MQLRRIFGKLLGMVKKLRKDSSKASVKLEEITSRLSEQHYIAVWTTIVCTWYYISYHTNYYWPSDLGIDLREPELEADFSGSGIGCRWASKYTQFCSDSGKRVKVCKWVRSLSLEDAKKFFRDWEKFRKNYGGFKKKGRGRRRGYPWK